MTEQDEVPSGATLVNSTRLGGAKVLPSQVQHQRDEQDAAAGSRKHDGWPSSAAFACAEGHAAKGRRQARRIAGGRSSAFNASRTAGTTTYSQGNP